MQENRRSAPCFGQRPVPVGDDHGVIKRIASAQAFVAVVIGGAHQLVVHWLGHVIGPQIAGVDRFGPGHGRGHAVGPIEHPHHPQDGAWRGTVAFTFVVQNTAAADGTGDAATKTAQPPAGDGDLAHRRCPDFSALVSR